MARLGFDKSKLSVLKKTQKEILSFIKPTSSEVLKEKKFIDSFIKKINKLPGPHLSVVCAGSFGKGTHLKNKNDYDIFVLYPPSLEKEKFIEQGLGLAQKAFKGYFWEKAYSQHPYIRGVVDSRKIEVVPAYKIQPNQPIISAVDRTVLHLMFILKNISDSQKDQVRLLKHFMQYIGTYGADASVFGFSGYLCELMILYYGDFRTVLESAANWKPPIKFSLLDHQQNFLENFYDQMVVIDPVDDNRNVASAVSLKQLNTFIAASRVFLENPSMDFFKTIRTQRLNYYQLVGMLDNFSLVVVKFEVKNLLKEIVWSKVKSESQKLISFLENQDFNVLKHSIYYKENLDNCYLIILLDTLELPKYKKVFGPFVSDLKNSQNYLENTKAVLGPYIATDKWFSIKKRDMTSAFLIISKFMQNFELNPKVYIQKDINSLFLEDDLISDYFSDFFIAKEKFLF